LNHNYTTSHTSSGNNDHRKNGIPLHLKTVRATLYILVQALNIVYIPIFVYRMFQRKRKCPPVTDPILRITAVDLAKAIRRRHVSLQLFQLSNLM